MQDKFVTFFLEKIENIWTQFNSSHFCEPQP